MLWNNVTTKWNNLAWNHLTTEQSYQNNTESKTDKVKRELNS